MKTIVSILISIILALSVQVAEGANSLQKPAVWDSTSIDSAFQAAEEPTEVKQPKFKKLKAALLALLLGHFGVHRIYLGTATNVPVVYSLTLGGGLGILPLIDFFHIVFTKDLSKFEDNQKVFMWDAK